MIKRVRIYRVKFGDQSMPATEREVELLRQHTDIAESRIKGPLADDREPGTGPHEPDEIDRAVSSILRADEIRKFR